MRSLTKMELYFLPLFGTRINRVTGLQASALSQQNPLYKIIDSSNSLGQCFSSSVLTSELSRGIMQKAPSFSTVAGSILVQAKDPAKLGGEIENAVEDRRYDDTWRLFEQHLNMDGFPRKSVVNRVLTGLAETVDAYWLEKAFSLVERAFDEGKQNLLVKESLFYLSFALAKSNLPVLASTVLRKLVETEQYPPVTVWSAILAYMSRTGPGAYLAAELVLEIGYLFQDHRIDPRKKSNAQLIAMKPNTAAFNIALAGCLLSGTTRKAEQLLDMMPRIGVKADANLLIVMAHVYERNGRRDELRKLQRYVDEACNLNKVQFQQFYNCLLNCHLKFGDLDSASKMVLEMLRKARVARNSLGAVTLKLEDASGNFPLPGHVSERITGAAESDIPQNSNNTLDIEGIMPFEEFSKDWSFAKLGAEMKEVLCSLLAMLKVEVELITSERGILQPTDGIYVKLAKAFLEAGKTKQLAEFLIKAEREDSPVSSNESVLVNIINACIFLGWLDHAHDLLDEMRIAGVRAGSSVYSLLVKAYCDRNRTKDAKSLLRDASRAGVQLDTSAYEALMQARVLQKDTPGALGMFKELKEAKLPRNGSNGFERLVRGCEDNSAPGLMSKLLREIEDGQRIESGVHDWNNVIHFFCKRRLMQDAEKALKKMRSLGHSPNAQTFHSMVTGYAAVGQKYTEVTELWGEMKSLAACSPSMKFDHELLDSVLYTFVRGGFFVRANEVVEMMEKGNMFVDKYKYRTLFLKYHKTLYKGKAPKYQTESQAKRREAGLAFKKWVGLS